MNVRSVGIAIATLVLSACAGAPPGNACGRLKRFRQYDFRPAVYQALPKVDITSLPAVVHQSLSARLAEIYHPDYPFTIIDARADDSYLLLAVTGHCFDCTHWFVYSVTRRCVVGNFALGGQG